jgi:plastocyanin
VRRLLRLSLLVLLGCAFRSAATAATLTVYVLSPDGHPAADVVVEVAMPGVPVRVPAEPVVIAQLGVRFVPQVTAIPAGTTVRFLNQDAFGHHLRSQAAGPLGSIAPAKDFEFRMAGARADKPVTTDVQFERAGLVVLGCHLHSSMRGHVYIGESALLGVTDAAGRVVFRGVPEGRGEIRYWHPQQLIEQPRTIVQVSGDAGLNATLNFKPARPRSRAG